MKAKLILTLLLAFVGYQSKCQDYASSTQRLQKTLGKAYNIEIYTGNFVASDYAKKYCTWKNLSEEDGNALDGYTNLLIEEWQKYPVEWVKKSKLKAIALVKKLSVVSQYRAAMPDAYGEVLYLDIEYLGMKGFKYAREVIHHEFYHMIEENYFGDFYYKDPQWMALNPAEYPYVASQGADAYTDGKYAEKDHPVAGFVSAYSRYALEEDKAEVYSYIMATHRYEQVKEWIKEDAYLNKKVKYMQDFIAKHCPEMDQKWFDKIHGVSETSIKKPTKIKIPKKRK
ncbi:MAG: putative zinc-binding metallopeptidase [Raineya sp.]|jgi:hypothetical protein|nr:putative zinc-binding metallopeptidase [Raineya sp.]